jgi:hypothetical protein
MELLGPLRKIWRRRLALGTALLLAIAVLVALGGTKSVKTTSATAWTRVTLDTPNSQLVAAAPSGAGSLPWRASLLSHLMSTESVTAAIARRLGVSSDQVSVIDPTLALPLVDTDTAAAATKVDSNVVTPYALTTYADGQVPVISLTAAAADAAGAKRLAEAAMSVLESESSPRGPVKSLIPTDVGVLGRQAFVISQVSPLHVQLVASSSLPKKPIAAALFVFLVWCVATLILLPRVSRRFRPGPGAMAA